ncbi:dipeptidyl aminopeptidase/acylaminoacyl-peptidase-like protein [Ktedonobacter racemifer DSM 44963]|uniref:Dipeptidyl aminopeptidase/acylaminoacyl-peptidase-like protein n=2 Tax=Ktedonobacter racemifer TaxID=363277 RepID=D6TDF9_KTERA|nr:dipeptidyl aminopeptidase/acylaminoacyl-peptidase-like protein [Ktedonobacter racemifer DSM 44963]
MKSHMLEEKCSMFNYDPSAPLDFEVLSEQKQRNTTLQDITYTSPKGGKVPAYLIIPPEAGPFAGVIFVHWGEGNRDEFVDEALELAPLGTVSLLIDAPLARPEPWTAPGNTPEEFRESDIQLVIDIQHGIDLLLTRPDIDRQRLGYVGHSLGATKGGIVAGIEKRVRAYVFMAGLPSVADSFRTSAHPDMVEMRATTSTEELEHLISLMEPLDAIHYVGKAAPAALFFQFARHDEFVTERDALWYEQVASSPKLTKWYETDHQFNPEARHDRVAWLCTQLSLKSR